MITASPQAPPRLGLLPRFGFFLLLAYLFVAYSRVFDMVPARLYAASIVFYPLIAVALFSGAFVRAFSVPAGRLVLALTAWIMIGIPFSVWRGGSFTVFRTSWFPWLMVYVAAAGLILTARHCRKTVSVLAWSALILALLAMVFGSSDSGRLYLPMGKFANPNDLGQVLLAGLPFWWFLAARPGVSRTARALALACMLPLVVNLVRTGSRGALAGFVVLGLVLLYRAPSAMKIQLMVAVVVILGMAALLIPRELASRYVAWFSPPEDAEEVPSEMSIEGVAIRSTEARWRLLKDSVALTLRHPLFGVGFNQFAVAQNDLAQERGLRKGNWQVTHNTYTQWSSENGLPALILFIALLVLTYRNLSLPQFSGPAPPGWAELSLLSFSLRLSLVTFTVSALFASVAYMMYLPVIAGFAVSVARIARQELNDWVRTRAQARQVPSPVVAAAALRPAMRPPSYGYGRG